MAQGFERGVEARFYCAERNFHRCGDFSEAQAFNQANSTFNPRPQFHWRRRHLVGFKRSGRLAVGVISHCQADTPHRVARVSRRSKEKWHITRNIERGTREKEARVGRRLAPPKLKILGDTRRPPAWRHLVKAAARATSGRSGGQTWFRADTGERVAGG